MTQQHRLISVGLKRDKGLFLANPSACEKGLRGKTAL